MSAGAGRPGGPLPGQPIPGQPGMGQQRSIFGTGRGPVFAQMPAYTPVTRATEPVAPPRQDYGGYAGQGGAQANPRSNPQGASGYANGTPSQAYQSRGATPDYPAQPRETYQPQAYPSQNYGQPAQPRPEQGYPGNPQLDPYGGRGHPNQVQPQPPGADFANQRYQQQANPTHAYQDPGFPAGGGFPDKIFPESTYSDASFADASYPEASPPDAGFAGQNFSDASFQDASFPEQGQDAGFAANEPEPMHPGAPAGPYGSNPNYQVHPSHGYAAPERR